MSDGLLNSFADVQRTPLAEKYDIRSKSNCGALALIYYLYILVFLSVPFFSTEMTNEQTKGKERSNYRLKCHCNIILTNIYHKFVDFEVFFFKL